jgi:hypothetical protein
MGLLDSIKAVAWARRRQPEDIVYLAALAHERFGPEELLEQAVEAERAGFDGVCCRGGATVTPRPHNPGTPGSGWAPQARQRSTCRWDRP